MGACLSAQTMPAHDNALVYEIAVFMSLVPDASRAKAHAYTDAKFRAEFVSAFAETCFPAGVSVKVVEYEAPAHISVRPKRATVSVSVKWPMHGPMHGPMAGGKRHVKMAQPNKAIPCRTDLARHIMTNVDWHSKHGTWPMKAPGDGLITLESPEKWTATVRRGRGGKVVDRVAYDGKPDSARNNKISFQYAPA